MQACSCNFVILHSVSTPNLKVYLYFIIRIFVYDSLLCCSKILRVVTCTEFKCSWKLKRQEVLKEYEVNPLQEHNCVAQACLKKNTFELGQENERKIFNLFESTFYLRHVSFYT